MTTLKYTTVPAVSTKAKRVKKKEQGEGRSINQEAVLQRDGEQNEDVFTKHSAEPILQFEGLTFLERLLSSGHAMYKEGFASRGGIFGSAKLSPARTS